MTRLPLERTVRMGPRAMRRMSNLGIPYSDQLLLAEFREGLKTSSIPSHIGDFAEPARYIPTWNTVLITWGLVQCDEALLGEVGDTARDITHHLGYYTKRQRGGVDRMDTPSVGLLLADRLFMDEHYLREREADLDAIIGRLLMHVDVENSVAWQSYEATE